MLVRCRTTSGLTGTSSRSGSARLRVQKSMGSRAPRLWAALPDVIRVAAGADAELYCLAEGYPSPRVQWFEVRDGHPYPLFPAGRVEVSGERLTVRRVTSSDAGRYRCTANSSAGGAVHETTVEVAVPSRVVVRPSQLVVNAGQTAQLSCDVTPKELSSDVTWIKDGRLLGVPAGQLTIRLRDGDPSVAGMYQCHVPGDLGTAQVRVGAWPARLLTSLVDQTVQPGSGTAVTLTCTAAGSPPPRFTWTKDGVIPPQLGGRYMVRTSSSGSSDVTSQLTVHHVTAEDGGVYRCRAQNAAGSARDSAKVNVYGPARALPRRVVTVSAGAAATLVCPVSGYPLSGYRWRREPPQISPFGFPEELTVGQRTQASCLITSGDLPIDIAWLKNNVTLAPDSPHVETLSGEFYSNLVFKHLRWEQAGVYTCRATNRAAAVQSSARLVVRVPARWLGAFSDSVAVLGSDVTLNCSVTGQPPPTVTWTLAAADRPPASLRNTSDGRLSVGADGSLDIRRVVENDTGSYACLATNGVGPPLRRSARLTVTAGPDPGTLSVSAAGRADGGPYTCVARNRYGEDSTTWHVLVTERPEPPESLELVSVTSRSALVTWTPPYDGNSALTHYVVQYAAEEAVTWTTAASEATRGAGADALQDGFVWKVTLELVCKFGVNETVSGRQRSALVAGLQPSTTYRLRAFAVNRLGNSRPSAALLAHTEPEPPAGPPLNVRLRPVGPHTLRLTWRLVVSLRYLRPATAYSATVRAYNLAGDGPSSSPATASTWEDGDAVRVQQEEGTTLTLRNLSAFTNYTALVSVVTVVGQGPDSAPVTCVTAADVPGPPAGIKLVSLSATSMLVSWLPPRKPRGLVTRYFVYQRKYVTNDQRRFECSPERRLMLALERLDHYQRYEVWVSALTAAGEGAPTRTLVYKAHDNTFHVWYRAGPGPEQQVALYDLRSEVVLERLLCGVQYAVAVSADNSLGGGPRSESIYISTRGGTVSPCACTPGRPLATSRR
ncbi:Down syndrome cell adhesion molecule-like protein Dscam2 [Pollicipes pollicipes]|uniref:Down syndrome cell adhesion molecule-like protein Dscam2 n=1 Tax=Pollicipes pollicipes TaxID=41117 RepID=UPI001885A182|nr:Down syndrome cell adhesion molecule-like protein Dscam2 [Pollicipes pollicipes]